MDSHKESSELFELKRCFCCPPTESRFVKFQVPRQFMELVMLVSLVKLDRNETSLFLPLSQVFELGKP